MTYLKVAGIQVISWVITLAIVGFGFTYIRGGLLVYGFVFAAYGILAYSVFWTTDALIFQTIAVRYLPRYFIYCVSFLVALACKAYALRMSYDHDLLADTETFIRFGLYEVTVLYLIYSMLSLALRRLFRT